MANTYWQFIRTCQECGHKQTDIKPDKITDKWLEKKCKKCKSESLDYGSNQEFDDKGNEVRRCYWCGQIVTKDNNGVLIDETGGDVCGVRASQDDSNTEINPPHE